MKKSDGKKTVSKFRLLMMALLALTFASGIVAGAFMYATGKEEILTPKMQMVSHTEYRFGEPGQIIARIVDFQGNPVAVTSCNATILYPDKTSFVAMEGMTASGIGGDYYYNFTTPAGPEGVYEYQATCFYAPNKNATVTNSFHLSSALTSILGNISAINTSGLDNLTNEFALVNSKLDYINVTTTDMSVVLSAVNVTTTNIYTYLTTTLATDIDDILTNLGIINATVNRIETLSTAINSTTQQILTNQENEVRMDVFSG